jgi:alanine racemase
VSTAGDRAAPAPHRWAWADIDLDAVRHNVRVLADLAAPARLWAVVKADGYGHGAVAVATAALGAGASALCVALVQEGVALRGAGIAAPIVVLSQQPAEQLAMLVAADLTPVVYTEHGVDELAAAVQHHGGGRAWPVHVKVDTGMHRVGVAPAQLSALVARVESHDSLHLAGLMTHLAVADEPAREGTAEQLARFMVARATIGSVVERYDLVVHVANSAGLIAHPAARFDAVRAGIALYGISPGAALSPLCTALRPVLSLRARVSHVQRVDAGESISYGWRHAFDRPTNVATVPIGYADGVPRRLSACGGAVLIDGRRRPIVGVVTMDQLMVDCGDDTVDVGDEVVLIGRQGDEVVTADEWAERLGTIAYEIVCGIASRVPRVHHLGRGDGRST